MPPGFKTYRLRLICRQTPRPIACGLYAATVRKLPPSHNSRSVSTIFATIVHLKSRHLMTNITSPLWLTSLHVLRWRLICRHQQKLIAGGLYAATQKPTASSLYAATLRILQPGHNLSRQHNFTHQLCSWCGTILHFNIHSSYKVTSP